MPRLSRLLGNFEVEGRVQVRTNHLWRATNHLRDGVVLIGDAFQTPCPAAGVGISRLLVDVDRLCTVHFPRWIEREGFSSPSIANFYLDPVKAASDASAIAAAEFRRNTSTNPSLSWTLYRETASFYRRLRNTYRHRVNLPRQGEALGTTNKIRSEIFGQLALQKHNMLKAEAIRAGIVDPDGLDLPP
jgi:hypothetical protein